MSCLTVEARSPDVPEPTGNGKLPQEAARRIQEASAFLPFCLAAAICLWCAYLIIAALLGSRQGVWSLVLVPTAGAYLFSWLAFYRHELWHQYFPAINNGAWYDFVSHLLFSDPQVYRATHSLHHRYVHTPDDVEFFCENWQTDRRRRKRQFILELLFGNAAWELSTFWRLRKQGRATLRAFFNALAKRLAVFLGLTALVEMMEPGAGWFFLGLSTGSIWFGAVMNRHVQWIEHLGVLSDGQLAERNLLTRNLSSATLAGKLFNWLYHHDAEEHVFHHTEPKINSRGASGLTLPPGARTITLGEYPRILWSYYRSL